MIEALFAPHASISRSISSPPAANRSIFRPLVHGRTALHPLTAASVARDRPRSPATKSRRQNYILYKRKSYTSRDDRGLLSRRRRGALTASSTLATWRPSRNS
jgi:hypothetical protein